MTEPRIGVVARHAALLMAGFPDHLAAFQRKVPFNRAQLDAHTGTVALRRGAGSASRALHDHRFGHLSRDETNRGIRSPIPWNAEGRPGTTADVDMQPVTASVTTALNARTEAVFGAAKSERRHSSAEPDRRRPR
jgi:hypothetical protein